MMEVIHNFSEPERGWGWGKSKLIWRHFVIVTKRFSFRRQNWWDDSYEGKWLFAVTFLNINNDLWATSMNASPSKPLNFNIQVYALFHHSLSLSLMNFPAALNDIILLSDFTFKVISEMHFEVDFPSIFLLQSFLLKKLKISQATQKNKLPELWLSMYISSLRDF